MNAKEMSEVALEKGKGILRLAPTWVPRAFCVPGRRIKLHPDDYYSLGGERGGIDERWFSSTTHADNGPKTPSDEGLSYIVLEQDGQVQKFTLREAVEELKGGLIGDRLWNEDHAWPMYSKFFDNKGPLPHHIHHRDQHAKRVGAKGKPEAYYFPIQQNNYGGDFPYTFFGFNPGTKREEVRQALQNFTKGDNKITSLSRCYRLDPGTGWDVPPGILHAPGSLCTYEPQRASDVFAQYQSLVNDQIIREEGLWKDMPKDKVGDFDYLMDVIDWELNVDPQFFEKHYMRPLPAGNTKRMTEEGFQDNWICYKSAAFSAKELSVFPQHTVTVKDSAAYGLIVVQGRGAMGVWDVESPAIIRYGQLTYDEFFVSESAARSGVTISNPSKSDPLVMLKHFGPGNPDMQSSVSEER